MGIVVRIPRDIYKEVMKIQREYKENGIEITFTQAMKLWYRKVKKLEKIPRRWKFPEFS